MYTIISLFKSNNIAVDPNWLNCYIIAFVKHKKRRMQSIAPDVSLSFKQ